MTLYRIIDEMDVSGEDLLTLLDKLPVWRREEALRFKYESGRRECTLSYLLLCDMLREHFGIMEQPSFVRGEHGKPALVFGSALPNTDGRTEKSTLGAPPHKLHQGERLFFNLSHCKRAVACAVSDDGEVGIDVECTGRYNPSLAEYCMSEDELLSIADATDSDLSFTRLWTRKEALLKYTGEGIVDDMKEVLHSCRTENVAFETMENKEKGYVCTLSFRHAQK